MYLALCAIVELTDIHNEKLKMFCVSFYFVSYTGAQREFHIILYSCRLSETRRVPTPGQEPFFSFPCSVVLTLGWLFVFCIIYHRSTASDYSFGIFKLSDFCDRLFNIQRLFCFYKISLYIF
jgi:hypothetical protein